MSRKSHRLKLEATIVAGFQRTVPHLSRETGIGHQRAGRPERTCSKFRVLEFRGSRFQVLEFGSRFSRFVRPSRLLRAPCPPGRKCQTTADSSPELLAPVLRCSSSLVLAGGSLGLSMSNAHGVAASHQDKQDAYPTHAPSFPHRITPTSAPVRHVERVPATIERSPSSTISPRLSGAIVPRPPIMIPRLPGLAKPHNA